MKTIIIALLMTCAAALHAAAVEAPEIDHDQLVQAIAAKQVVLIDVNGTDSWKAGHIADAIDYQSHAEALATLLPQDKSALVVAYCGGPQCNAYAQGVKAARALGYTNVKHYKGGITGWKQAGGELTPAQ